MACSDDVVNRDLSCADVKPPEEAVEPAIDGLSRRMSNLRPGNAEGARKAREAKAAKATANARPEPMTADAVRGILASIVSDPDESGSYRTAAARLLLDAAREAGACQEPCCRGGVSSDVMAWLLSTTFPGQAGAAIDAEYAKRIAGRGLCVYCLQSASAPSPCARQHPAASVEPGAVGAAAEGDVTPPEPIEAAVVGSSRQISNSAGKQPFQDLVDDDLARRNGDGR